MKKKYIITIYIACTLFLTEVKFAWAQVQIDKDLQLTGNNGERDITGAETVDASIGYLYGGTGASGNFLRGNGTHFVASAIQAGDLPSGNGNYIQNQIGSPQAANFYISGDGRAGRIGVGMAPSAQLDVTGLTRLTRTGVALTSANSGQLEIYNGSNSVSGGAAMINFHRGNVYGAHFGLDTDNWFSTQGWSAGTGYTNLRTGTLNAVTGVQYNGVNVIFNSGSDVYGNFRVLQNNSSGAADGMYLNYNSTGAANAHLRFYANGTSHRGQFNASTGNLDLFFGLSVAGNAAISGTTTSTGRISANGGISASGSDHNFFSSTFGGQNWLPFNGNGQNYFSAAQHNFRSQTNGGSWVTINSSGIDINDNLTVGVRTNIGNQGIFMPNAFDPSSATGQIGNAGNFISFGHSGQSEDFLGYRQQNFYFRDTPGGGDTQQPTVQAQAFTAYSSKKWKTNIQQMTGALELVQRLRGVRYNYVEGYNDGKSDFGFIAEEVYEVLPEVIGWDAEGISGVDYGHVTPVLVEAIKEQQKQIEELKKQNATIEILKAELDYLKEALLKAQR